MGLRDWFSRKTRLELAIERGLREGGALADEIRGLDDYVVRSRQDGEAICAALETVLSAPPPAKEATTSDLYAITRLFQNVDDPDADALDVLAERGTPLLISVVDEALNAPGRFDEGDVLFVLKILAMYGTAEGTDAVIRAARHPFNADGYLWSVILSTYSADHPESERLYATFREGLPPGFLTMAVLDGANQARLAGSDLPHPFDTSEGHRRLEQWLTSIEEDEFSYAISATAAIPFLSSGERDRLLALAMDHADTAVQLEAAWASAKLGRDSGVKWLARYCLNVNHSDQAKRYLDELGRSDAIPAEATTPDFAAKAEFAEWLAHPNELGRPPDELEIVDHRVLAWPPEGKQIPVWLIRYRVRAATALEKDDEDVGMVGSMTFCFFSYNLNERPPEDGYAIHCCWELEHASLIAKSDVDERSKEYNSMLAQWKGKPLDDAQVSQVVELASSLNYPQTVVAVASARQAGEPGWVVLDGPRSAWYPAASMPDSDCSTVWRIHIGRALLGFHDQPDRRRFLKPPPAKPAPQAVIDAYERLLADAATAPAKKQKDLLGSFGLVGRHWEKYIAAVQATGGEPRSVCVARCYEKVLQLASHAAEPVRNSVLDSLSAVGEHLGAYVDALIELDRKPEIAPLVEMLRPLWQDNLGFGRLGAAAFKAGNHDVAEGFFVALRTSLEDYGRAEEMAMLAEIWHLRGENAKAHELLVDCLRQLVVKSSKATGSDRDLYEKWFQGQREAFLRLFPAEGQPELLRLGIPASTLT